MIPESVPFDPTDPMISIGVVALTEILKKLVSETVLLKITPALPVLVFLLSIFVRVLIDAVNDEPLTVATFLRGLASAGVAVLTHTQFRSVVKALTEEPS